MLRLRRDRAIDGAHILIALGAMANPVRLPTDDRATAGTHQDAVLGAVAELRDARGASDLAIDPEGRAWVVTERAFTLVPVDGGPALAIEGVPDDVDLEALTFVGPGRFLLGTERHRARTTDTVLAGRIAGGRAIVEDARTIDYAALGVVVAPNQGLEGMCTANGHTLLAVETPRVVGTARWGVLLVDDQVVELALGSPTGKLSALACAAAGPHAITLWAIERHYGVARLLRAELALDPLPARVAPELWTNLAARIEWPLPNFEGLAIHGDELWLVNDDQPSPPGVVTRVISLALTSTRGGS